MLLLLNNFISFISNYIKSIICMFTLNYSGEDDYQSSRLNDGIRQHIFTTLKFKQNTPDIKYILENTLKKQFHNSPMLLDKFLTTMLIRKEFKEEMELDEEELWKTIKEDNPLVAIYSNKRITLLLDHRYFGGLFFVKLGCELFNAKPVCIYHETYIPFITEWYIIKLIFYWLTRIRFTPLKLVKDNEIKRSNQIFKIEPIDGLRRQTILIHKIVDNIYSKIHNKVGRPIRILIPVAFESTRKTFNNVGGIFIDYDGEDIYTFEKMLMNRKYQAHATNIIQKFINSGKNARQEVDIVLSAGCLVDSDIKELETNFTSYLSVAHYPIYVLSVTFNDTAMISITSMTDLYDPLTI